MKITYLLLLYCLVGPACKAQQTPWPTTKNWKVYSIAGPAVFSFPADSLPAIHSTNLIQDSVQFYLQKMQPVPTDRKPTWMGAYLGSYESGDGKLHKIEIGAYGGYFYDTSTDQYFSLPRQFIRSWQKFISHNIPN